MGLYSAGVDVGSTQTKAVVLDPDGNVVGRALIDTGADVGQAAESAYQIALEDAGITRDDMGAVIGTGYGRYRVTFGDSQVTEISCHGRGAVHMFPDTKTVLDMGGQDTKAIRVNDRGEVLDFCMNDKCAAGTGRFLGAAASALEINLPDLGPTSLKSDKPIRISTTCTVFAESEVLSWLGRGSKIEDILMGVHESIVSRSVGLLRRVGIDEEVTFTGGVAKNIAMIELLNNRLTFDVNVSDDSHYMGALGAALYAQDENLSRQPADAEAA